VPRRVGFGSATPQPNDTILQGTQSLRADAMPVVHMARIAIGVMDQQVYTIGIATPHQREQNAFIAFVACQPTMREQLEAAVIALDHDQRFPDLATVLQKKLIA
jgi:hypothetical protein